MDRNLRLRKAIRGALPIDFSDKLLVGTLSFPTASQEILGTKKLSAGPTVVVLRIQGHWLFGALVQNLFSVAGPSTRPNVNQMLMQPFVNYNLKRGWYLASSPIITANWEINPNQRWEVPVGAAESEKSFISGSYPSTYTRKSSATSSARKARHTGRREFRRSCYFPKNGFVSQKCN